MAYDHIDLPLHKQSGDLTLHLQRITGDIGQMVPLIQHQQQILRRRQHRLALQRRHHQRMIGYHHIGAFNFAPRQKKRAVAKMGTAAVQAAGPIGAHLGP